MTEAATERTKAKTEQTKAMMDCLERTIDSLAHNWPRPRRRSTCLSSPATYRAKMHTHDATIGKAQTPIGNPDAQRDAPSRSINEPCAIAAKARRKNDNCPALRAIPDT